MATQAQLSDFLASAQRRAYKQALYAIRDPDAAMDVVQEAMIKLAQRYGDRPEEEFAPLFTRIVQNAIRDHFRRQSVRSTWMTLFSSLTPKDDPDADPIEALHAIQDGIHASETGVTQLERKQTIALIEQALSALPARQREAFLLRYWEELDVGQTAEIMKCSEGSVKTHCHRAIQTLSRVLREHNVTP